MLLLIARGEMRKEFEAEERTMVAARDNNPLKLMADPHEAMQFLFDPTDRTDGFLDPVQSIGDACEDLRAHELALMAGMRAAILGALRRFDPQVLEKSFEKSAGGFALGSKKAKLWEAFIAQQQKLTQEAQEDFNKVFGRDSHVTNVHENTVWAPSRRSCSGTPSGAAALSLKVSLHCPRVSRPWMPRFPAAAGRARG